MQTDGVVKEALELQQRIGWVPTVLIGLMVAVVGFVWFALWPLVTRLIKTLSDANAALLAELQSMGKSFHESLARRDADAREFHKATMDRLDRIDEHLARART